MQGVSEQLSARAELNASVSAAPTRTGPAIGYTTGVFDMFHVGHLNVLRRARALCDHLIVGVTTDELCVARKAKRPVIPFDERREIVAGIRFVDTVVAQSSMDKLAAWTEHRFHRMFVGDDWRGSDLWNRFEREFAEVGVELVYLPYTMNVSSTVLRERTVRDVAAS